MANFEPTKRYGYQWQQFACEECGNTFTLPVSGDERPWCWHGSNYSWREPVSGEQAEDPWTQMTPVSVLPRGEAALLRTECEKRGMPVSLAMLLRHINNHHAAIVGMKDSSIKFLEAKLNDADASGLPCSETDASS